MHSLLSLSVFCLLPLAAVLEEEAPLGCVPRRNVPHHSNNAILFHEDGVFNYSTMLLREDLGVLLLGAREIVFALDISDISNKRASIRWEVTAKQAKDCSNKGKNPETDCKNYIRVLHSMTNGTIFVCGTNAFDPECDYLSYADEKLTFKQTADDGKGKCPFDPFQRSASIMVDNQLYSATSMNFLGSEPILMRSSAASASDYSGPIRTEFKSSWLNEPNFVSMAQMPESDMGDDDKVYLFFSETAVECDCFNKLEVSRVARVCKGDLGGRRTLQKKWTSFLKTRMDCPVLNSRLPYVIQDSYLWCDPTQHWENCIFYAIFTPQSDTSDLSAVCAYRVSDISRVFSEGKYKSPVTVETSFVKWVMYSGEVPEPRPGACINNEDRKAGKETLDLPDRTLQFVKDRPLMDQPIQPIDGKPVLMRKGAAFTRIVVHQVQAADGEMYRVMFIGTEEGTLIRAVNYGGKMFIIEEIELFKSPEPIDTLKFSNLTGQLYAGSNLGVAQIPLATCERSLSCTDCVLARDPYCGWDMALGKCVFLSGSHRSIIQSVEEGNASLCPEPGPIKPVIRYIWPGGNLKLGCRSPSNHAQISWERDNVPITFPSSPRFQDLHDGLLILNASASDAGHYRCLAVESSKANKYTSTVAEYQVSTEGDSGQTLFPQARTDGPSVDGLNAVIALLAICLVVLLIWNLYKGHIPLPWNCMKKKPQQSHDQEVSYVNITEQDAQRPAQAESKPLMPAAQNSSSNNNHSADSGAFTDSDENSAPKANLPPMQFIDDESEI